MQPSVRGERSIRAGALLSQFWTDPFPRLLDQDPFIAEAASQLLDGRGGSHYLRRTPLIYFLGNPRKSYESSQIRRVILRGMAAWVNIVRSTEDLPCFLSPCQEIAIASPSMRGMSGGSAASSLAKTDIACSVQGEMRINCVLHLQAAKLVLTFLKFEGELDWHTRMLQQPRNVTHLLPSNVNSRSTGLFIPLPFEMP